MVKDGDRALIGGITCYVIQGRREAAGQHCLT